MGRDAQEIKMENIDTKDVAKLVRKELKTHFPRHKFSVRIERYSMGSSINVTWIDGPMVKEYLLMTVQSKHENYLIIWTFIMFKGESAPWL
jgi:conjugative element/phage-associated large polyvalent protein